MSLIKKIDVEKHFAARRAMRLGRTGPVSPLGAAGIKSPAKRKKVPASAEALTRDILRRAYPPLRFRSRPILAGTGLLRPPGIRQQ